MFTQAHLYVTLGWDYGTAAADDERGQVGFRVLRPDFPDTTHFDGLVTGVTTWWSTSSSAIPSTYRLSVLKIAQIDTSGHYPPTSEPMIHDFLPGVAGGGSAATSPMQTATVLTLDTAAVRGHASRGRVYLPPIAGTIAGWPKYSNAQITARAAQGALLVNQIAAALEAPVAVMSSIGEGTTRAVTAVRCGDVPDVQRSRARNLVQTYATQPL